MRPSNKQIAHILRSVAAVYELKGANRFRIIAYNNAADTIDNLNRELVDIWENKELSKIAGIGSSMSERLAEYFEKGDDSYLIKTIQEVPAPIFDLMRVPGIGVKKAFKLVSNLHLEQSKDIFSDIIDQAKAGNIAPFDSFGEKSQSEIIAAVELYEKSKGNAERMPLPVAHDLAMEVIEYVKKHPHVGEVEALGSLRRWMSTIGDIDLVAVVSTEHFASVIKHFVKFPGAAKIEAQGENKASIILANGRRIDLRVVESGVFGSMIQYFTGSKAHNIKLRELALKKGYSISEYGIGDKSEKGTTGRSKTFASEKHFYEYLGVDWIPPELREGTSEIDIAIKHQIPELVKVGDIKGDFHIHSNYDLNTSHDLGRESVVEIAQKAQSLGYEYIAISDHNPAQNVPKEKVIEIMKKRFEYMKSQKTAVPCFVSLEIDITPSGELALPDEAFKYLDMAVVSLHRSFRQNRADMTKRVLKALSHEKVKIFGHPTGRQLGKRPEVDVDWTTVFKFCKERNIALEINSWPERLDLPDMLVREAKEIGCIFTIDTDAHTILQMDNMFYGVSVARRGWLDKDDIINTQSLKKVSEWIG